MKGWCGEGMLLQCARFTSKESCSGGWGWLCGYWLICRWRQQMILGSGCEVELSGWIWDGLCVPLFSFVCRQKWAERGVMDDVSNVERCCSVRFELWWGWNRGGRYLDAVLKGWIGCNLSEYKCIPPLLFDVSICLSDEDLVVMEISTQES